MDENQTKYKCPFPGKSLHHSARSSSHALASFCAQQVDFIEYCLHVTDEATNEPEGEESAAEKPADDDRTEDQVRERIMKKAKERGRKIKQEKKK